MSYTHLRPADVLEIRERAYFDSKTADLSAFIRLSPKKLAKLERDSITQEQVIFSEMCEAAKKWKAQAEQTLNYRKAQEYLKVPATAHTANQWTVDEYGLHRVSNMVYKMTWRVYEGTRWSDKLQKSVPTFWELTWSLTYNTPPEPDYSGHGWEIAGQSRKRFGDKAEMDKYLQGRIKAYAHLFTDLSPPIPKGQERRFSVNGVLLPGYTVEVPEKTPQEVADELLGLLDADELAALAPDPQPEEISPQEIWEKHRKQHPGKSPGKRTPAR